MPPRKSTRSASKAASQPPASPPLDGLSIAISGTFFGATHAVVQQKITGLGASITRSVNADTTHLVTTQADYGKASAKVKDATTLGIPIVSLDWIEECISKGSKVAEAAYQLNANSSSSKGGIRANGKKRGASASAAATDAEDDEEPQSKKTRAGGRGRAAKSATHAAIKDDHVEMEDGEEPAPKGKAKGQGETKAKGKGKAKVEPQDDEDVEMADAGAAQVEEKKDKKEVVVGQTAKSADLQVPVDEFCSLGNYTVFIDPNDGLIWDASLNQTNAGHNNNKFYKIQVLTDGSQYKTWTRWGRVGERGQNAILGNGTLADATRNFEKKFKDKSGLKWADRLETPKTGKYVFVEKSYNEDSDSDSDDDDDDPADSKLKKDGKDNAALESKLHPAIQDLMGLIFNSQYWAANMANLNYDANKLPLGKLSRTTITRGFQALKDISEILDIPNNPQRQGLENASNLYYSLIPHDFGRQRPPVILSQQMLKKEIELLESLSDMKDAQNILKNKNKEEVNILDQQFAGLNMNEMTPLDQKTSEFKELKAYLTGTKGRTHNVNYQVQQIFRIERQGEKSRFEDSKYMKIPSDRRLLWHGSRVTNFGGILSQGLRIAPPEAPVSGYMFGKGIYLADMSSKSAGYCCTYISGGTGLLLLCEAELGAPMQELTQASYNAGETAKKGGMHSTWGKGSTGPSTWKDAECVHPSLKGVKMPDPSVPAGDTNVSGASLFYNEYIAYNIAQIRLRYLFRVKF